MFDDLLGNPVSVAFTLVVGEEGNHRVVEIETLYDNGNKATVTTTTPLDYQWFYMHLCEDYNWYLEIVSTWPRIVERWTPRTRLP